MTRAIALLIVVGSYVGCSAAIAQDDSKVSAPSSAEAQSTVDLQGLLETVSENSGKKFLVDSQVPARISVRGTEVDDPGYPVLLSILRNNGLAAVEIQGYVNILPDAAIRQLPLPIVQRDDADIPDDMWVSRIITVRSGSAPHLVPILRPLLPQEAHLAAPPSIDGRGNQLIIVASYAKVKDITRLVEMLSE